MHVPFTQSSDASIDTLNGLVPFYGVIADARCEHNLKAMEIIVVIIPITYLHQLIPRACKNIIIS